MNVLVDVVWNNMSLRTASTMNFLVDDVWNNLSLRTASTMHNERLGVQFSRTDCSRHHPPRRSLCIVLAVLKDRLFQKTSTKKFIVLAVLNDRLFQTPSTKRFIVHCTCSSQGQIVPENIHIENCRYNELLGG
jgi:hypothetical protein